MPDPDDDTSAGGSELERRCRKCTEIEAAPGLATLVLTLRAGEFTGLGDMGLNVSSTCKTSMPLCWQELLTLQAYSTFPIRARLCHA